MTVKEKLLERAKELHIKGAWSMKIADLEAAVAAAEGSAPVEADEVEVADENEELNETLGGDVDETLPTETPADETVKVETAKVEDAEKLAKKAMAAAKKAAAIREITRHERSMKPRGTDGKVIRKGKNLSGNTPFAPKPYYIDLGFDGKGKQGTVDYLAAPKQVRCIYDAMVGLGITSDEEAKLGAEIVELAKSNGWLTTKIEPAKLFAYYRRALDILGLQVSEYED